VKLFQTPPAERPLLRHRFPVGYATMPKEWSRVAKKFQRRHPELVALDPTYMANLHEARHARNWFHRLYSKLSIVFYYLPKLNRSLKVRAAQILVMTVIVVFAADYWIGPNGKFKDRTTLQPINRAATDTEIDYSIDVIRERKRRDAIVARGYELPRQVPPLGMPVVDENYLLWLGINPERLTAFRSLPEHPESLTSLQAYKSWIIMQNLGKAATPRYRNPLLPNEKNAKTTTRVQDNSAS
jgi:hypothetical protein